jgi:hypothetical protein
MAEHRNPALKSGVSMFIFTNHYRGIYEDLYNKCSKFFKPMGALLPNDSGLTRYAIANRVIGTFFIRE